ncbi:uncharacterized protein LOC134218003 isoform X2 [Armigeres subalbatus]|uniref:uncharacterized protein LOC134218003 isoform X2 n=1 Tax=Armigeres subalbatus TaxID=124917 RepID=UPI002ED3797D
MADALIIEEKDLIADFVAHAPADCFDFLKAIGFNTFALLTIAEDHFCATLSQFPNSWGAEQIWIWIHQWRQRNHLDTIVVPQETNIEGILSPVEAPTTEIETFLLKTQALCLLKQVVANKAADYQRLLQRKWSKHRAITQR